MPQRRIHHRSRWVAISSHILYFAALTACTRMAPSEEPGPTAERVEEPAPTAARSPAETMSASINLLDSVATR
ncbi:MAG: hypothetical protein AAF645_18500, partial [Myxococcota bacterium]